MSRKRARSHDKPVRRRALQGLKRTLAAILAILLLLLALLIFKAGVTVWPDWLVHYRSVFIGVLGLAVIFLGLMTPVILEFMKDPRPLSGPGKNPEIGQ